MNGHKWWWFELPWIPFSILGNNHQQVPQLRRCLWTLKKGTNDLFDFWSMVPMQMLSYHTWLHITRRNHSAWGKAFKSEKVSLSDIRIYVALAWRLRNKAIDCIMEHIGIWLMWRTHSPAISNTLLSVQHFYGTKLFTNDFRTTCVKKVFLTDFWTLICKDSVSVVVHYLCVYKQADSDTDTVEGSSSSCCVCGFCSPSRCESVGSWRAPVRLP